MQKFLWRWTRRLLKGIKYTIFTMTFVWLLLVAFSYGAYLYFYQLKRSSTYAEFLSMGQTGAPEYLSYVEFRYKFDGSEYVSRYAIPSAEKKGFGPYTGGEKVLIHLSDKDPKIIIPQREIEMYKFSLDAMPWLVYLLLTSLFFWLIDTMVRRKSKLQAL